MEDEPPCEHDPSEFWFEPREHPHADAGGDAPGRSARLRVLSLTELTQPVTVLQRG